MLTLLCLGLRLFGFVHPKGRATLDMRVKCKETSTGPRSVNLTIVLDGYNAPVSAGQFVDLVQKGFYNGMEIQRWGRGSGAALMHVTWRALTRDEASTGQQRQIAIWGRRWMQVPGVTLLLCCLHPAARADGFVVQTGDPEGKDEGYRDPATGEIRT